MKQDNKKWISICWIVLGVALILFGMEGTADGFWCGAGGGLLGAGIMQVIRRVRYERNEEYKEEVDTQRNDERNKFLAAKAWNWAGYLYMMISAVATFVFKVLGMENLSVFCGGSVCLILVLYWFSYLWLRKKY